VFDNLFYTDRVEIECAGCTVQRFDAQQQQQHHTGPRRLLIDRRCSVLLLLYARTLVVLKFVTSYDVRDQISRQTNKLQR